MAAIGFEHVTKRFDDGTVAVADLDLDIADGEVMVLVGPSGSGKSTALRMLAGLEESSAGTIRIGDQAVDDVEPKDRDVAMVFQSYALYPHMTVAENLGFALRMQGTPRTEIRRRVEAAAHRLGLDELLERRPRQLSGGQRQRVALGRAVVRDPAAFLMDEPLSNLDAKLRVEMRAYLARLHQELGTTTVYVTHDQTEAMTMGDRVAVMRAGRLEQVDRPQRLYDAPCNVFVAGFMGSPAMNLVRGRLSDGDGGLTVAIGGGRLALPPTLASGPRVRAHQGGEVIVGFRPEAVAVAGEAAPSGRTLEVDVLLTEALGADLLVHAAIDAPTVLTADRAELAGELPADGHARVTLRLPPSVRVAPGERLTVAVDAERLHLFDPVTENALS